MFKDNLKQKKQTFSFEQELDLKLKTLKNGSNSKTNHKQEMTALIDDTVFQLQGSNVFGNMLPAQSKYKQMEPQIQQLTELELNEGASLSSQEKTSMPRANLKNNPKMQMHEIGDHIWNLVSRPEVIDFLKQNFRGYREDDQITLIDFIQKALTNCLGREIDEQQIYEVKDIIKNDVTTTNPQMLSLNALQILTKKNSIRSYLLQSYVGAKVRLKLSEMERKNKKILRGVTSKIDDISQRELQLQAMQNQLLKRETNLKNKERTLNNRQKQHLQRQKEFKKSFQEKCVKMAESYLTQVGEITKESERRLVQLEKGLRNKMEIMQKRTQNLKFIIKEHQNIKSKKVMGDSEAKIRLRKLEKEFESIEKRYKGELDQFKSEEKELLKSISQTQEKMAKNQKKYKKQKQKVDSLEGDLSQLKVKCSKLEEENKEMEETLRQLRSRIPQENVMKEVKSKENTTRSTKNKKNKDSQDASSAIFLYELVLSLVRPCQTNILNKSGSIIPAMKEMLPLILGRLCSEDEEEEVRKPHNLVLLLTSLSVSSQSLEKGKVWSKELSELLKMPFPSLVNRSLFLFLLPLLEWSHKPAVRFFSLSMESIIADIQQAKLSHYGNPLAERQRETVLSSAFLCYLIKQFVFSLKETIQSCEGKEKLELSLQLSFPCLDILISISSNQDLTLELVNSQIIDILIDSFLALITCIIRIYNAESTTERKRNQTVFQYFQRIEELSEKLSILIQRIIYQTKVALQEVHIRTLQSVFCDLEEINQSNGMRYALILANLRSSLDLAGEGK